MQWLKDLFYKIIGKKVEGDLGIVDATSKAKLTAIIGVLLVAIPQISAAFGHPITIPDYVLKILEFAGLYAVRDAIKS